MVAEIGVIDVAPAGGQVLFGLVGQEQRDESAGAERGEGGACQLLEEGDPGTKRNGIDAAVAVAPGTHGVVGRVAENQVAFARFPRKPVSYVVFPDLWTHGMEIIRKTATSHRFADVERGASPGHGIDDESPGRCVVVQGMGDDRRRDRARMRDAEGAIVPERPDVVGRRAKPRGEAVAPPQVFVSRMDRLGPGVEREQAAPGAGVAGPRDPPDGAGLAVEILASETDRAGDRGIRTTRQAFPTVGIPTLGNARPRRARETGGGWRAGSAAPRPRAAPRAASASRII